MLVTDSDLVFKLRSLPYEAREELLKIVGVAHESADDDGGAPVEGERAEGKIRERTPRT